MDKQTEFDSLSCADCKLLNCYKQNSHFPKFCLTTANRGETEINQLIEESKAIYQNPGQDRQLALTAAEIEGLYYGKITRVEEIILFAKRSGFKKIGIATCIGLIEETRTFSKIVKAKGLECFSAICKVGSVDKTEIGLAPEFKLEKGCHESLCNPVLQAKLLNQAGCELNVIVGLCVGHDSLFNRHSEAPVTTLVTKDRVLGHNPVAALYGTSFYYKRLLEPEG